MDLNNKINITIIINIRISSQMYESKKDMIVDRRHFEEKF